MSVSRQGLRRFRALQPSSMFHDQLHPAEGRYSKVLLDQRRGEDSSQCLRRAVVRERNLERKKMGLSQTKFHGIPGLPDCEYIGASDLVGALADATESGAEIGAFLEQLGHRLKRDSDLLPVSDLIAVLDMYRLNDYLDIGLFNRLKNELVFDADRISSPAEIGTVMHAFRHFEIFSPKLVKTLMARIFQLPPDAHANAKVIVNLPKQARRKYLGRLGQALMKSGNLGTLALGQLVEVGLLVEDPRIRELLEVAPLTEDTKTCANLLALGVVREDLLDKLKQAVGECSVSEVLSLESIMRRNQAGQIAGTIVIAASKLKLPPDLVNLYLPALHAGRGGLRAHQLVTLAGIAAEIAEIVQPEIRRRYCSFSDRQKTALTR